jgi:tRNA 2-thiouridine synthesizing protein A
LIIWSQSAASGSESAVVPAVATRQGTVEAIFGADRVYDAGDKGCAAGPMDEIAALLRKMESGQTLEICATDPTVTADLAAWCRMTGNTLVEQRGIHYLVRKK